MGINKEPIYSFEYLNKITPHTIRTTLTTNHSTGHTKYITLPIYQMRLTKSLDFFFELLPFFAPSSASASAAASSSFFILFLTMMEK